MQKNTLGSPLAPQENPFKKLFILPLLRYWPLAIALTASGLVAGTLYSLTKPNEYESIGRVHVRFGQRERLPADFVPDTESGGLRAGNTDVNNVFHNLNSIETFRLVAERVGPEVILAPYDPSANDHDQTPWPLRQLHSFQSWWFAKSAPIPDGYDSMEEELREAVDEQLLRQATVSLQMRSRIQVSRNSHVIEVYHQSPNPETAQTVTAAFIDIFNQRHRSLYSTEEFLKKVRELKKKAEDDLRDVNEAINALAQEKQVSPDLVTKEKETLVQSLSTLRTELETARAEHGEVLKSLEELNLRLESEGDDKVEPFVTKKVEQAPLKNSEYDLLQARVTALQIKYDELAEEFAEGNDKREDAKAAYKTALAELKNTPPYLDPETKDVTEPNPRYFEAIDRKTELKARLGVLAARIETSSRLLNSDKDRLENLKGITPQLSRLERKQSSLITTVQQYQRVEAESKPAEQMDESNKTNLYVVQQASLPFQKSGPNRIKFVMIGLGGGLLISLTLVALLGFADRRIRRPEDLEDLGLKVLAIVPASGGWRKAQRRANQIPAEPSPNTQTAS